MKSRILFLVASVMTIDMVIGQVSAPELAEFDVNKLSYSFEQTLPDLSPAYIESSPSDRKDGILVGSLAFSGDRLNSIVKLAKEISEGNYGKYDGMLISHKGKLVFESYFKKGRINLPHFQASVTKAYISLAVGRAIQLGYLTMADLNKPIHHFLKNSALENLAEGSENITLHQLMTMRSGIRVSAEDLESIRENGYGTNPTKAFLQRSAAISLETQTFNYQGIDPRITWQVLDSVVPGSAEDFVKNEILRKIGITVYGWKKNVEGSNMTSRDMLKLGTLVINRGKWNGEQLISGEYMAVATNKVTNPTEDWIPDHFSYGYFWYQMEVTAGGKSYMARFAWGGGGQYIVTVEELDLIVVITGHDAEDKIISEISEIIIPTFAKEVFPPLEDRYFGENHPGTTPKLFAPDIVSPDGLFEGGSFSPDMKQFYFTRKNGKYEKRTFFVIRYENGQWGNESETDIQYPRYSADGNIMYKGNKYRERTESGWSELLSMGAPFTDKHIMGISVSNNGTFFFDQFERPDTIGAISYSRLINGKYEPRQKMGVEINTGAWIAHPHIARDESYLIWDVQREDGYGGSDIYISFRHKDGHWLPAMNMGDKINTELNESGAGVTPDGKYLFFSRGEWKEKEDGSTYWVGKPYWVDTQVIEQLRPLNGPYLGQNPPGMTPKPFAPGNVTTADWQFGGTFTPDLNEFYFIRENDDKKMEFVLIENKDDQWHKSVISPRVGQPFISPDGKTMHLGRRYKERTDNGWSEIKKLDPSFQEIEIMRLTASSKGTYVLDEIGMPDGDGVIRYSRLIDGKREAPRAFGKEINTGRMNAHPFIAPDESYLLWDGERESGYGDSDIYISFRKKDGSWGEAINLGATINTEGWEASAYVTPDGKYLFFNRNENPENYENVDILWVDAKIIEDLRPQL